jgi:transposase
MLTAASELQKAAIVIAGIDTHKDTHHVALIDLNGRELADDAFPVTTIGYQQLLDWVSSHGLIDRVGIELTGSYGAGLTRFLHAAGITVVEVNTTDKATRARRGKDDRIDAFAAAHKVLAGMATATPKDTTGLVESIRVLKLARDSAVKTRTKTLNQIKDLRITAPAQLRESLDGLSLPQAAKKAATFRCDRTRLTDPTHAVKLALKRLGERVAALDKEITDADKDLTDLVTQAAPTLITHPRIGIKTAAQFIVTIGANINRIHSDAAFARICGAAPIPVSSGKTNRMRLHRGGDRQANSALHIIVIGRFKDHQPTIDYRDRKLAQGHSKRDIIRALKRYVAREVFNTLKTDRNPQLT